MADIQTTFQKIAESLLMGYSDIFYINAKTCHYQWFTVHKENGTIHAEPEGNDFFAESVKNMKTLIYPEDQPMLLDFLNKESMLRDMRVNEMRKIVYRLMIDGKPVYHTIRLIRGITSDDDYFIIGVLNVDETVRREKEHEKLEMEHQIYNQVAKSLADQYDVIYYVNMESNHYREISKGDFYKSLEIPVLGDDFFNETARNTNRVIHPEDRSRMHDVMKKETVIKALEKDSRPSYDYRLLVDGQERYTRMIMTWAYDRKHVIFGVENIDDEVRRIREAELQKMELAKKSITYNRIAGYLAARYEAVYYVDTELLSYVKFDTSKLDQRKNKDKTKPKGASSETGGENDYLEILKEGYDFYGDMRELVSTSVIPEDRDKVIDMLSPDRLADLRDTGETGTLIFRVLRNMKTFYMNLRVVWVDDARHLIIGYTNVDNEIREKRAQETALQFATEQAERDGLTGVKNVIAYQKFEAELQAGIDAGTSVPFSIAVFDLNRLKQINDSLGHKVGDQYISDGCSLICHTFLHSPVFRIGGDEFCAILKGSDYINREDLCTDFREKVLHNMSINRAVIAIGISDYRYGVDRQVSDVFKRADDKMYENKQELKNLDY